MGFARRFIYVMLLMIAVNMFFILSYHTRKSTLYDMCETCRRMEKTKKDVGRENFEDVSPFIDQSGNYSFKLFAYVGEVWRQKFNVLPSVCLATHSTVDGLFWLAEQANAWDGLMSVSIFVPGKDILIARAMIEFLQKCSTNIYLNVSFHFVYPVADRSKVDQNTVLEIPQNYSCSQSESLNSFLYKSMHQNSDIKVVYPQNLMRNIARRACSTTHTISVDIDMISRKGMASDLEEFLQYNYICEYCAYIIPIYEISDDAQFPPVSKKDLISLRKNGTARVFHQQVYNKNQGFSKLKKWERTQPTSSKISTAYRLNGYEEYWEPIVVLHSSAPEFDERFVGYGNTRNSHILILYLESFSFYVLENAFLAHRGFQVGKKTYSEERIHQINVNRELYNKFKEELENIYGKSRLQKAGVLKKRKKKKV